MLSFTANGLTRIAASAAGIKRKASSTVSRGIRLTAVECDLIPSRGPGDNQFPSADDLQLISEAFMPRRKVETC